MSDAAIQGLIATIVPTVTVIVAAILQWKKTEDNKKEAIVVRQQNQGELKQGQAEIHELVNNKADVQVDTIKSLKMEIARLNREGGKTPDMDAGEGAPGEVGIKDGVVTAERRGPFKPGDPAE